MRRISVCIGICLLSLGLLAQPCKTQNDLLGVQGKFLNKTHPSYNQSLPAAVKPVVAKYLNAVSDIMKKDFTVYGGDAHYFFDEGNREYFDTVWYHKYSYNLVYYQYVCSNGQKKEVDEYRVDFYIQANAALSPYHSSPGYKEFYEDGKRFGYIPISIFRFISYPLEQGEVISSGKGRYELKFDNIHDNEDIHYVHYVTKSGMPLLLPVSRKEFLESLLEFYKREKVYHSNRYKRLMEECDRSIERNTKSGNDIMVRTMTEDKRKLQQELLGLDEIINEKVATVERYLKGESPEWLAEQATHQQFNDMRMDDRDPRYSMAFKGFLDGPETRHIYRFNPALAASKRGKPGEPLYFKVRYRYKETEKFSQQITESTYKNLDFEAIRKLL